MGDFTSSAWPHYTFSSALLILKHTYRQSRCLPQILLESKHCLTQREMRSKLSRKQENVSAPSAPFTHQRDSRIDSSLSDRTKRVKDARSEAQKEIDEYRQQKEEEFKKFEKEHTSGNKKAEQDAENETEEKLKETKDVGKKSGNKVVEDLLKAVSDVRPVVPQRVKQPTA
ncbi:putative vacuolar (H+)-ATPase G subunit [Elsinoe australis]|uniref:V-type proton ATPase subunit G n=1 Tax=Elsinoe australis TaxID=40998 RepID=A0A4U7AM07_9PEZI|nr:putative vacuolar (H+)-ATPase G subunit [Elsinoe australis]